MGMTVEPVRDIMRRTMHNLEFVEAHARDDGLYEVTQLVNSFLGALVQPWETYRDALRKISLTAVHNTGWPVVAKELPTDCEPRSLGDLIRYMRNALAHGNVQFMSSGSADIQAIRVWSDTNGPSC